MEKRKLIKKLVAQLKELRGELVQANADGSVIYHLDQAIRELEKGSSRLTYTEALQIFERVIAVVLKVIGWWDKWTGM